MKKHIIYILVCLLIIPFFSCKKRNKSVIEIYLPNQRIDPINLVPVTDLKENRDKVKKMSPDEVMEWGQLKYDTITNRAIHAGEFVATVSDLDLKPLVKDSEILNFNFETNELQLHADAKDRIGSLSPAFVFHNQFILTIDQKPILTGYFKSSFSSWPVDTYCIEVNNSEKDYVSDGLEGVYKISKGVYNPELEVTEYILPDLKGNAIFYDAFSSTNRSNN